MSDRLIQLAMAALKLGKGLAVGACSIVQKWTPTELHYDPNIEICVPGLNSKCQGVLWTLLRDFVIVDSCRTAKVGQKISLWMMHKRLEAHGRSLASSHGSVSSNFEGGSNLTYPAVARFPRKSYIRFVVTA